MWVVGGPSEGSAYEHRFGCARTFGRRMCVLMGTPVRCFSGGCTPDHREILEWMTDLPAPVAVTYEAGPTGFGLARALIGAGIDCRGGGTVEAAATGGGSGQDRRPRCRASSAAAASGPDRGGEDSQRRPGGGPGCGAGTRGLSWGCNDKCGTGSRNCCCGRGSFTTGGQAWTGKHEMWLRGQRFDTPGVACWPIDVGVRCDGGWCAPPGSSR